MRRRWPALAATIPLVLGWAVATAHPASASTPVTGPGPMQTGPVQTGPEQTGTAQTGPEQTGTAPTGTAQPGSVPTGTVQPGGPVSSLSTPGMPSETVTPQISGQQPQAVPGGGQSGGATSGGTQNSVVTSSNWAGYVASGSNGTFTSASSSWTQPTGRCTGRGGTYAAFWVGLDGYTSPTVEQIGSEVDCSGATPRYYAWYEIYPGAAVNFTNPVSPGDKFSGSVTYTAPSTFNLVLTDTTKNWTQRVSGTLSNPALSSAEVIAEAPCCTFNGGILPLTSFGTASFTAATANGKSLSTYNPTEIVMPNTSVSAMDSTGAFSVSYTGFPGFSGFPWFGTRPASD